MKSLIVVFCLVSSITQAQYSNAIWCFGDSAGINFNNGTTFNCNVKSRGSCVSISDSLGSLLCYAYTRATLAGPTTKIYNGQHQLLLNGTNIIGQGWYRELTFVPFPDNDSLLYLFSVGVTNSSLTGLFYSLINYKNNGGLGEVISKNNQLLNYDACDGLTAIKHGNGRDWWVFFKKALVSNNVIYRFLITPNGISNVMTQNIGSLSIANLERMSFNHFGNKLAIYNGASLLEVFDFDRCTGLLSNATTIHTETNTPEFAFQFSEFSPNDSLLYVSTNNSTSYLYQFNLNAGSIWNSRIIIDSISNISEAGGDLKLAPDGKIYHARAYNDGVNFNYPYPDTVYNMYNTYLSVINNPDVPGMGCNFTPYSFYLDGNRTYWGLPNNPDYTLPRIAGSPCDTILFAGITPIASVKGSLMVTYINAWQILFLNAKNLKGRNVEIKIYDLNGRLVYDASKNNVGGYFTQDINCNLFTSGMYVVRLLTEKESLVSKFIKE